MQITWVLLFRFTLTLLLPLGLLGKAFPKSRVLEAFLSTVGLGLETFLSTVGFPFEPRLSISCPLFLSLGFDTFLSKGWTLISLGFLSTLMFSYTGILLEGLLLDLDTITTGDFLLTFSCTTDRVSARGDFSDTLALDAIVGAAYPRAAVRMPVKVLRLPEGKPIGVRIGEGTPSL